MKLGDVLKKERGRKRLSAAETASRLGISEDDYLLLEAGETPAEIWGPLLAQIAIQLQAPTARLLAESGRSADTSPGQAGELIRGHRERRGRSRQELAEALGIAVEEYASIEAGTSELERYGPLLLAFAKAIEPGAPSRCGRP